MKTEIKTEINSDLFNEFVDYVSEFYEEGKGIYENFFTPRVSRKEIELSALLVASIQLNWEFSGDSIDRERVREILHGHRASTI